MICLSVLSTLRNPETAVTDTLFSANMFKGAVIAASGHHTRAARVFENALTMSETVTDIADALHNTGYQLYLAGNKGQAIKKLRSACDFAANDPGKLARIQVDLAEALLAKKDTAAAGELLANLVGNSIADPWIHGRVSSLTGQIHYLLGHPHEALRWWRMADTFLRRTDDRVAQLDNLYLISKTGPPSLWTARRIRKLERITEANRWILANSLR